MIIYLLIETQDEFSEFAGDNVIGVYAEEDRATAEMEACKKEYAKCGHEYRIEPATVGQSTWLKEED